MTLLVPTTFSFSGCRYYFSFGAGKYIQHTNKIDKEYRDLIWSGFFFSKAGKEDSKEIRVVSSKMHIQCVHGGKKGLSKDNQRLKLNPFHMEINLVGEQPPIVV